MQIRGKLIILLLGIALLPLGLLSWLAARATQMLGDELAGGARQALDESARSQLKQIVEEYGQRLRRESSFLEFTLRVQAREVERCLVEPPSSSQRVYLASDIDTLEASLPGARPSTRHLTRSPRGERVARQVSYEQPVIYFCPGADAAAGRDDAARLTGMAPVYRFLTTTAPRDLILWQHTTLKSGVHSVFPGHGRFPPKFDPCRSPTFVPREDDEIRWSGMTSDPSTDSMIMSLSLPVERSDGTFAGITTIDIDAADILRPMHLPAGWARGARAYLVTLAPSSESVQRRLRIIASQELDAESGAWQTPDEEQWLTSEDATRLGQMSDKMSLGQPGVWPIALGETPHLWAHARAHAESGHIVTVVPMETAIEFASKAEGQVRTRFQEQLGLSLGFVLILAIIMMVLAVFAARSIVHPLHELTRTARRIAAGDLDARADVRGDDEIGELGRTFNAMVPQLRDGMRLRESLALAQEVQQALLPGKPPTFAGFDICGISQYCEQTGGDYYDFLDIAGVSATGLGIAVGDVTGHGVAAALLMATARALLRGRAAECASLGELLSDINRHLSHGAPPDRYMTLYYMVIDAQQRTVRWASAGHDAAIVYSPDTDEFSELRGNGIPLALEPTWAYDEHDGVSLRDGQIVLIGTDGIWEMHNDKRQMFGKDAVRSLMKKHAAEPAERIVRAITDALRAFRGPLAQEDDVTLVVVRVL